MKLPNHHSIGALVTLPGPQNVGDLGHPNFLEIIVAYDFQAPGILDDYSLAFRGD